MEGIMKQTMEIRAVRVPVKPDYMPLARHLVDKNIAFYEDPENVKAYEKWKKEREEKQG